MAIFAIAALAFTGLGFLPGRVLVPLDLQADEGAWKPDPDARVPVSNRLLSDPVLQFVPWDEAARRAIRSGEVPWRNPYSDEGRPLFANAQAALLSPFTWPRLLFGIKGWALCVFLKLFVAGMGAYWLTREMGAERNASLISGFVYLASGFSIVWALHPHTNTFALLPLLAAALLRQLGSITPANTAAIVGSAAIATAGGHPETLAVGVLAIAGFLAWEALSRARGGRPVSIRGVAWLIAPAAAGFLLLAVQLVPFLLLLAGSEIAATRFRGPETGFRGVALFGQILPGFLGSPLKNEIDLSVVSPDAENFNTRSQGFVGLVTLVLLATAARRLPPTFRRGLVVGIVALPLAWGVPPFGWISKLWGLSLLARPYWILAFVLFASAAAGPAVTSIAQGGLLRRAATALIAAGCLAAMAGILPAIPAARPSVEAVGRWGIERLRDRGVLTRSPEIYAARFGKYLSRGQVTVLWRLALPGFVWILAGAALLRRRRKLLAVAVAGELLAFGIGYIPAIRSDRIPKAPPAVRDVLGLDPQRRWMVAASADVYPPNLGTFHEIRDVRPFDLLESSKSIERLRRCGYDQASLGFAAPLPRDQAFGLAKEGVRFLFSRVPAEGCPLVGGGEPPAVGVYELPGYLSQPIPANEPPTGVRIGAAVSVAAALGSILLVRGASRGSRRRSDREH
jgi:hypothetical protein